MITTAIAKGSIGQSVACQPGPTRRIAPPLTGAATVVMARSCAVAWAGALSGRLSARAPELQGPVGSGSGQGDSNHHRKMYERGDAAMRDTKPFDGLLAGRLGGLRFLVTQMSIMQRRRGSIRKDAGFARPAAR